ncbi:hypothetical protein JY651_03670 [Pyxidicoccus parkwayensis]|jgi:hypothetical protein|uniref:Uncharacterized protein n=2 Tax=Pyxidicoccus parkwayensis TaxID=2813578 RepID=A0ABX7PC19_9BACT|nr:hypothetical protein JY651_03670 [Pyxidicoccus parkwaysis]
MTPGVPYEPAKVDALLAERRVAARPDGLRVWHLRGGDVEVAELREGGQVVATELRVPLSDRPDLVREVVTEAAALAAAAGARLVDPQLGRSLSATDDGVVVEQYMRTAWYAGHVGGMSDVMSVPSPSAAGEPSSLLPSGRFIIIAIGVLIALYLVVDTVLGGVFGR